MDKIKIKHKLQVILVLSIALSQLPQKPDSHKALNKALLLLPGDKHGSSLTVDNKNKDDHINKSLQALILRMKLQNTAN